MCPLVAEAAGFWLVLMYLNLKSLFEDISLACFEGMCVMVGDFLSIVGCPGSLSTEYGLSQESGAYWPHNLEL